MKRVMAVVVLAAYFVFPSFSQESKLWKVADTTSKVMSLLSFYNAISFSNSILEADNNYSSGLSAFMTLAKASKCRA